MERRTFVGSFAALAAGVVLAPRALRANTAPLPLMTIYKSPSCGCCKDWVKHVQAAGFKTKIVDMDDLTQVKKDAGVPEDLQSCHTALVGAYVVEGHVPADLVQKLLTDKTKLTGLAVGGMVVGSPGMEQGSMKQPYNVMAFTRGGKSTVYARR
jgi:hypothetical protein